MSVYKKLYYCNCAAITDALEQLNRQNYGLAKQILSKALSKTEQMLLDSTEKKYSGKP